MNKTVSVNISGFIFNIEEAAFEKLNRYLNTIRGYFSESAGAEEIIEDIEARIAELFQQRISDNYQVIKLKDVDEVIDIMGQPEAYIDEGMEEEDYESAGIPKSERKIRNKYRKIYRDPDDNVLGGVAAGIGHYFGIDPIWVRIFFIVLLFLGGSSFLIYIILWIIIPQAKTAAEKLEMKGDPVTVENIGKKVSEEYDNLKKKFSNDNEGLKRTGKKAGNVIQDFFEFLGKLLYLLVKSLGKIIGFIFVVAGLTGLVGLIFGLLSSVDIFHIVTDQSSVHFTLEEIHRLFSIDSAFSSWTHIVLAFILGIPLIGLAYLGFGLLTDFRTTVKGLGLSLFILWFVFSIIGLFMVANVARNYQETYELREVMKLEEVSSDTLVIEMIADTVFDLEFAQDNEVDLRYVEVAGDRILVGTPILDIEETSGESFEVEVRKESRGKNRNEARKAAEQIDYDYYHLGSIISFSPFYSLTTENGYRFDKVKVEVKVPVGKSILLKDGTERIIYDIDNVTNTYDQKMVGKVWTMTDKGLECIGCNPDDL